MARAIMDRPLVLGDLSRIWRFLKYALIPFVGILVGAGMWVNDVNAKVSRIPRQDSLLVDIRERQIRTEDKVNTIYDLLLRQHENPN